jgi:hypothetical protein
VLVGDYAHQLWMVSTRLVVARSSSRLMVLRGTARDHIC